MSATSSSSFPLATETCSGTECNENTDSDSGDSAGSGTYEISEGGLIAIIVVVLLVAIMGIASATLFYLAKKREWRVRETIRRSAKKVVTALTPRRTEFPRSVKEGPISSRSGRARIDEEVPPTPQVRPEDLEKGLAAKVNVNKYFQRK